MIPRRCRRGLKMGLRAVDLGLVSAGAEVRCQGGMPHAPNEGAVEPRAHPALRCARRPDAEPCVSPIRLLPGGAHPCLSACALRRSCARSWPSCCLPPSCPVQRAAGEKDVPIRIDDRQIRAAGIEVARVEPEGGTAQTMLPGTVIVPPQQLLVVAAPAAGLIESVLVGPNETVRAGQPIAPAALHRPPGSATDLPPGPVGRAARAAAPGARRADVPGKDHRRAPAADHPRRPRLRPDHPPGAAADAGAARHARGRHRRTARPPPHGGRAHGQCAARWRGARTPRFAGRARRGFGAAVQRGAARSALDQPPGAVAAGARDRAHHAGQRARHHGAGRGGPARPQRRPGDAVGDRHGAGGARARIRCGPGRW